MLVLEKTGGRLTDGDDPKPLVDRALAGDAGAVHVLIASLTPVVRQRVTCVLARMCRGRGLDLREEAQDLTQDVLLRLFRDGGRIIKTWNPQKGASLSHFVGLIARRQAISALRGRSSASLSRSGDLFDIADFLQSDTVAPDREVTCRQELALILDEVRARLSPLGLELFRRLFIEEEPVEVICTATKLTPNAVYIWRTRLVKLARALESAPR